MQVQTTAELTAKKCQACEGGVEPATYEEAQEQLKRLPGWYLTHDGKRIRKDWTVKNFMVGIRFFNDVAALAEEDQHHPDLDADVPEAHDAEDEEERHRGRVDAGGDQCARARLRHGSTRAQPEHGEARQAGEQHQHERRALHRGEDVVREHERDRESTLEEDRCGRQPPRSCRLPRPARRFPSSPGDPLLPIEKL